MKKLFVLTVLCFITVLGYSQTNEITTAEVENPQPQLVEKVEAQEGKVLIPYEKWVLPNGLTVIVHEDHSDPIVHTEVRYHVGSARESLGKSGFAHFFEHMMFQGSVNVGDDEHFKIVREAGGTMNGYTTNDNTVYFETMPSNYLETALWLEADRMGFLLDSVTQRKFEIQRKTVKNEKAQNQLNVSYGLRAELTGQLLYPQGHPYSWPVIGYVDDLDRVDVEDLKNFFLRWYGPNNAILTVGGDVNAKEVIDMAMKYFGPIPRGAEVKKQRVPLPVVADDKYSNTNDDVYLPMTQMVLPSVPMYHRDEAALDLLAMIMGDGKSSIMYQNLVKSDLSGEIVVFNNTSELAGEFTIIAVSYPMLSDGTPISINDIEQKIRESLKQFQDGYMTDEALVIAKKKMYASFIQQTGSVSSKVNMLSGWHMYLGRSYNLQNEIDRYNRVKKEDLVRVFNRYVAGKNAVFTNILPLPPGEDRRKFKKESFNPNASIESKDEEQYKGLIYNKGKDNFDRSKRPKPTSSKQATIPSFYEKKLANGIDIIGTKFSETPMVVMSIGIDGGHLMEGYKGVKPGAAWLTSILMNEGTKEKTTEEISDKLDALGSTISFSSGTQSTNIFVSTLKENLDATLQILEEKLLNPGFREDDFKRVKKQALATIKQNKNDGGQTASKVFNKLIYGETILGSPNTGTYTELSKLKLDDTKSYYANYYSPSVSKVVVVGDITETEIFSKLNFLEAWKGKEVVMPILEALPSYDKTQIFLVHQSDFKTTASNIRIGYLANPYDATGTYYKTGLMNFALGGMFNSRINMNLREDKGYTYGARSWFSGSKYSGPFVAAATVKPAVTDSTIIEFIKEIKNYRGNGITEAELAFTKSSYLQEGSLEYETLYSKAGYLSTIQEYGLPSDYKAQQAKIVTEITKTEINELAKEHLKLDNMVILVVGNKYLIKEKLEALGYGKVKELDKEGN